MNISINYNEINNIISEENQEKLKQELLTNLFYKIYKIN